MAMDKLKVQIIYEDGIIVTDLKSITGALKSNTTHVSNYRDYNFNDTDEILFINFDMGRSLLYKNITSILKCQLQDL